VAHPARAATLRRRSRHVASGLRLELIRRRDPPLRAYVLRVRLDAPVRTEVALAGRELPSQATTLQIARRSGALAAVNGDFGPARPAHALAIDGELVTSGISRGPSVGFAADGASASITRGRIRIVARPGSGGARRVAAWNARDPGRGRVVAYSDRGGTLEWPPSGSCTVLLQPTGQPAWSTGGGVRRPYEVEDRSCRTPLLSGAGVVLASRRHGSGARWIRGLDLGSRLGLSWSHEAPALTDVEGGTPRLVRGDEVVVPRRCASLFCELQPRTGLGISRGCVDPDDSTPCTALLVVVDGRRWNWSIGMKLRPFAKLMRRLGSFDALNFDGGRSSTMVIEGEVVNRPVDHRLRRIPAALLVMSDPDEGEWWATKTR